MPGDATTFEAVTRRSGVIDAPYKTAEDFLKALDPALDRWSDGTWLFRGHWNADWQLKARGLRPGEFERVGVLGGTDEAVPAATKRRDQQNRLLKDFARRLDEAGIAIPADSPFSESGVPSSLMPPREWYPLMALAQHHGLPTLLLDWTRRSKFAAYFAAREFADDQRATRGAHLAVFALDIENAHRSQFRIPNNNYAYSIIEQVQAPGGTNPNLRAQAGTFTVLSSIEDIGLDEHLQKCVEAKTLKTSQLYRLLLPWAEAPRLMRLLALDGIDGASMFPGTDGVVRAMRERAAWGPLCEKGARA